MFPRGFHAGNIAQVSFWFIIRANKQWLSHLPCTPGMCIIWIAVLSLHIVTMVIFSVDLLMRTSTFYGRMMMKKIVLVTVSRLDRSENEPHLAEEDVLQMVKISGLELTLGL